MVELAVELYGTPIGTLVGSGHDFDFHPSADGLSRFGIDSTVLSVAIPLAAVQPRTRKKRRQNFFQELLPEGEARSVLARRAGLDPGDVLGLLGHYGRDLAGALQIWDTADPMEPRSPSLEPVSDSQVAEMLRTAAAHPLGNSARGGKTSLAGVQEKIVLAKTERGWARALDGSPSTHIAKPISASWPTMIFDEEYGARIAKALGLASHQTWIEVFDGVPALVIERYDRDTSAPGGRIHQEDFNQALGCSRDEKYQRHGGKASLVGIAGILSGFGDRGSLERLYKLVVLAVAIGNLDLHAKNLALVHPPETEPLLAPAYDVVPMAHLPNDGELALAVAGEYRHAAVNIDHLIREGRAWKLSNAEALARETLDAIAAVVRREAPHAGAHPGLAADILRFSSNLLEGRPARAMSSPIAVELPREPPALGL